jgi:hypothetical protein
MTNFPPAQVPGPKAAPDNAAAVVMDGKRYLLDQLGDTALRNISSIRFCDEAIQQRRNELAVVDTARIGYEAALKRELAKGSRNDQSDPSG